MHKTSKQRSINVDAIRLCAGWQDTSCHERTINIQISRASTLTPKGGSVGSDHFFYFFFFLGGGQNLNFNIFGGFQKNEYFWRYEDFVDNFLESSENWTGFRSHFLAF